MTSWLREPGQGAYAKAERERRFLLTGLPASAGQPRLIEDHYILGTRMRLRRVHQDDVSVHKFCQKVRFDPADPSTLAITNFYLSAEEYRVLRALPAAQLTKSRRPWQIGAFTFAVDEFHGHLQGLLLAEIELTDLSTELPLDDPLFGPEVTRDDRFSGGALAGATAVPAPQNQRHDNG